MSFYRAAPKRLPDPIEDLCLRQLFIRRNQMVTSKGLSGDTIFTFRSGWVASYRLLREGGRQVLSFLLPGNMVRVIGQGTSTGVLYRAMSDAMLCEFDASSLLAFLTGDPTTSLDLVLQCWRGREPLEEVIISPAKRPAVERIARLVISVRNRISTLASRDTTSP